MDSSAIQTFIIIVTILLLDPIIALEYPQELINELYADLMKKANDTLSNPPAEATTLPFPPARNSSSLAPALFVIGDSSVDSGTNNFLGTLARADRPPYGRDFDTHQPTGRFCNGRIPVDYIGKKGIQFFFFWGFVNEN